MNGGRSFKERVDRQAVFVAPIRLLAFVFASVPSSLHPFVCLVPSCPGCCPSCDSRILSIVADLDTLGEILLNIIPKLDDVSTIWLVHWQCHACLANNYK